MKLKLDESGNVVVNDGKPVYTDDAGKEIAFDVVGTQATISRLNAEAKGHREAKEAAEKALKKFEGIEDPAEALKAVETIKNLDAKKLIDAGEVDKVKAEVVKVYEDKLAAEAARADQASAALNKEMIGGAFARSKFISEKVAVPADLIQSQFGAHFALDNGKIIAKHSDGNPVYSKANPGNPADFDEALEIIVEGYAYKDQILKGTGNSGGGSKNSNGGGEGSKTLSRAQFEGLAPQEQAAKMKDGYTLVDS